MRKVLFVVAFGLATAGCNTIQNKYVDSTGMRGSGTTTFGAMQENGKFSITDEKATCRGVFEWKNPTAVFPVQCTDRKSGTVTMTRPTANASQIAGEGTIQFTDGTERRFVFGKNI
ncbi:hypothetical protein [Shinella sp. M31]|uniref:hypothetical protein n=1 Tax=Shinella sp. M31 TaxID=3368615 RepID=UPI003BA1A8E0